MLFFFSCLAALQRTLLAKYALSRSSRRHSLRHRTGTLSGSSVQMIGLCGWGWGWGFFLVRFMCVCVFFVFLR